MMTDTMASPAKPEPMEIDSVSLPYEEELYMQTLQDPVKSLIESCLQEKTTQPSAAARMDSLEVDLRSHLLELSTSLLQDDKNVTLLQQIQEFWIAALQSCLHLVYFSTKDKHEAYAGMGAAVVRKLPFVLLEDIVETLPLHLVLKVWTNTVEPSIPLLCGGDKTTSLLWVKTSHLVWIRLCNKLLRKSSQGDAWAGDILKSLASVFPLSERSAVNVLGSFHTDNVTQYESLEEFEQQKQLLASGTSDSGSQEGPTTTAMDDGEEVGVEKDYDFYQTFWSIQQDFANPNAMADVSSFIQKMQRILSVLESQTAQATNGKAHETVAATSTTPRHSSCSKYLTNSQLLHLQLRDAEVRIHFLTQFLIIESYLDKNVLSTVTKRVKDLLRHTLPHGPLHLKTLEWLLQERESMWRKWKKNKCTPDLEKKSSGKETLPTPRSNKALISDKNNDEFHFSINVKEDLPAISRAMVENVVPRDVYSHLEDYVEALDPEAGIEAEYHPKNDKSFCWRTMRLLARTHLGMFGEVRRQDGDFEGLVRHVFKKDKDQDIPGDAPEVNAEPLEEFEEPGKTESSKESQETLSDDVSVGSPMEEEETKAEDAPDTKDSNKAEFEKAALEEEEELAKQENEEEEKQDPEEDTKKKSDEENKKEAEASPPAKKEEKETKATEDGDKEKQRRSEKPTQAESSKRGSVKKDSAKKDGPRKNDNSKSKGSAEGKAKGRSSSKERREEKSQQKQPPPSRDSKDGPRKKDNSTKSKASAEGNAKERSSSKERREEKSQQKQPPPSRDSDRRGRGRRQGDRPSPGRHQAPPDRGSNSRRSSPDRGGGRRDGGRRDGRDRMGPGRESDRRGGTGRDSGGRGKRDRNDRDDRRGSWGEEDRGGKRGRQGGGRRSY